MSTVNLFKKFGQEKTLLVFFIAIFILIRSINFSYHLDFSTDQGTSSSTVLDIVRNNNQTLIGPRFTLEYKGRYIFFGPVSYYFQAIFLILGNFDPIRSSYFFMLFASLMIIPLFYGTKTLVNKNAALFLVILYSLLPFFIDYSRFLWNPTFQFVLLPVLVWLMSKFKSKPSRLNFFWVSLFVGILQEFHYLFFILTALIGFYYFIIRKVRLSYLLIFISGIVLGMSPLILFDIRNNFYLSRTTLLFFQHFKEVFFAQGVQTNSSDPHYRLTFVFFGFLILGYFLRDRITSLALKLLFLALLTWSLISYSKIPSHGFGMAKNWNYLDEAKVHQIIKQENFYPFNVSNLVYDTRAEVQKYLARKDNINIQTEDYTGNRYLYVIASSDNFLKDPAYEVKSFQPSKIIGEWVINSRYNLYLAEKI